MAREDEVRAANLMYDLAQTYEILPHLPPRKIGETYQRLPQEKKDILKHLRSDDLKLQRWPLWR